MSDAATSNSHSPTTFDRLPTDVILGVFDLLSLNDVVYSFFHLNRRLDDLLLQHTFVSSHFELPTTNLEFWQKMYPLIGPKIFSLKVTADVPSIPWQLFPHLRSIHLSSSDREATKQQLRSLLTDAQFDKLVSLRVTFDELSFTPTLHDPSPIHELVLTRVFSSAVALHTFHYTSRIASLSLESIYDLGSNFNLRSLTVNIASFHNGMSLLIHAPNLQSFSLRSTPPFPQHAQGQALNIRHIKLKHLEMRFDDSMFGLNRFFGMRIDFGYFASIIRQLSSSLTSLSLNFTGVYATLIDEAPFHGTRLQQQLLRYLTRLQHFHLYAVLHSDSIRIDRILSTFQDRFWLERRWIVGMHHRYLYTLPFHFDRLCGLIDFNQIKSITAFKRTNDVQFLRNVTFLRIRGFNLNILKAIRTHMPNLQVMSIDYFNYSAQSHDHESVEHGTRVLDDVFASVTTVHLTSGLLENEKGWLVHAVPNLRCLNLAHTRLLSKESDLSQMLTNKIHRLTLDGEATIAEFEKQNHLYFSNLQHLQLQLDFRFSTSIYRWYADMPIKFFGSCKHLRTLSLSFNRFNAELSRSTPRLELMKIVNEVDVNELTKTYDMCVSPPYVVFSRKGGDRFE